MNKTIAAGFVLLIGCGSAAIHRSAQTADSARAARELSALHDRHRVAAISTRTFGPGEYWEAVSPFTTGSVSREEVGKSAEGRPLYLLSYGNGATRVLLWSQMHGDESTASMALADLMQYLHVGDERARRWAAQLSIHMMPVLNPDGAERFHRENALGIDVNRDARAQSTPEARALKAVRDRLQPQFGFNLHDQNVRTRVGNSDRLAAISLLAPPPDAAGSVNEVRRRAMQVAAIIRHAIEPLVGDHITKYDESFNPRAFGDLMQQWGTSTVLIESGGWRDDAEKQYLRKVNFVALVSALDAIAEETYTQTDVAAYVSLPPNGRAARDLVIRGGTVVIPGLKPYRADIAVDGQQLVSGRSDPRVVEVGDLAEAHARDTVDATGLFVHPLLVGMPPELRYLRIGGPSAFVITATPDEGGARIFMVQGLEVENVAEEERHPAGPPHGAVGCYNVELGAWSPDSRDTHSEYFKIPSPIRLLWVLGTGMMERGRLLVREVQPESRNIYRMRTWKPVGSDSATVTFSTGFVVVEMRLAQQGTDWNGTARFLTDVMFEGKVDPTASVRLLRIKCD